MLQALARILVGLLEVSTDMLPHFLFCQIGCFGSCVGQAIDAAKEIRKLLEEVGEFGKFNQKEFLWWLVPPTGSGQHQA